MTGNILAVNIGQKSVQLTCISGKLDKVEGLFSKISFANEGLIRSFSDNFKKICLVKHINQIVISNLGPYSTYSQGLVHGFIYSFVTNNSRFIKFDIYSKKSVINAMGIDRYSEYFRKPYESLTTKEVNDYLDTHPLLEKINYENPSNRGTRYSDVLAFHYLEEVLQV